MAHGVAPLTDNKEKGNFLGRGNLCNLPWRFQALVEFFPLKPISLQAEESQKTIIDDACAENSNHSQLSLNVSLPTQRCREVGENVLLVAAGCGDHIWVCGHMDFSVLPKKFSFDEETGIRSNYL